MPKARPAVGPAALLLGVLLPGVLLLAGCSSGGSQQDPSALLKQSKQAVDSANTVHVTVTASGATGGLKSVEGDFKRPDQFQGTISVSLGGSSIDVPVVSTGGVAYAKLPLTSGYTKVDPSQYGVEDPGQILDKNNGLSTLLIKVQNPTSQGQKRINGEVVDEVSGQLPKSDLAGVLPVQSKQGSADATFDIADSNKQLRRAVISGDLNGQGNATYTVNLDKYGEQVTVSPPG